MMFRSVLFFFFLLISFSSPAQLQVGLFAGISNYQGDLSEKPYQAPGAAAGLLVTYPVTARIQLRTGITIARVSGADSLNAKPDFRLRNLSFQSTITEFQLAVEYLLLNPEKRSWTPYLFGGLAFFHFNPYSYDQNGTKIFLQPLGTEGQGLEGYPQKDLYAKTQLALPFGGGVRFSLNENMRLSLEIGLRKLFTDYLDDVSGNYADAADLQEGRGSRSVSISYRSDELPGGDPAYPAKGAQRGSPKYKDYYYFSGIQFSILLPKGEGRGGYYPGRRKGYGCPVF